MDEQRIVHVSETKPNKLKICQCNIDNTLHGLTTSIPRRAGLSKRCRLYRFSVPLFYVIKWQSNIYHKAIFYISGICLNACSCLCSSDLCFRYCEQVLLTSSYRKLSNIRRLIRKLKCFSPRLAVVSAQYIEAKCSVGNEDVVGVAPTGDVPTTPEWSTI